MKDIKDIRVSIIDDHSLFRDGLCRVLKQYGIRIVVSTGEAEEGIQDILEEVPDVVLLDIRMPKLDGIEVLKILRKRDCQSILAMLTTSCDSEDMAEAMKNGAQGYLTKNMEPDQFIKAIHGLVNGEEAIPDEMRDSYELIRTGVIKGRKPLSEKLTPRENEVLNLVAEGRSNKSIARLLEIAVSTVKLHVKAALKKLNVHSRVEAAVLVVEHNLRSSGGRRKD